jgi:hypothetical protein
MGNFFITINRFLILKSRDSLLERIARRSKIMKFFNYVVVY